MMVPSTLPLDVDKFRAIGYLYETMSARRKTQLALTLVLMVVGAVSELVTIGATLPFLALVADPARLARMPVIPSLLAAVGADTPAQQFAAATALLVGAVVVATIVRLVLTWVSQKFAFRLGHDISVRIYERLLHQSYEYHVQRNTSEVIAGFEKINVVVVGVLMPGMLAITSAFMALVIVAALLWIDPFTAVVAAASVALLYVAVSLFTRRLLERNGRVIAESQSARVRHLQEGLGGIRDVLIDHSQPTFVAAFRRTDDRYREPMIVNSFVTSSPRIVVEAFGIAVIALLALYMAYQPGGVLGAIPVLGALAIGAQRLLPLLQQTYVGWSQVSGHLQSIVDVVRLMDIPTMLPDANHDVGPPFAREVRCRDVRFAYNSDGIDTLRDIAVTIRKGERIGIVGQTGSGKSTLIDLLMGLLRPSGGELLIDGVSVNDATREAWQRQIAHVPQAIYLADATIGENIAFGEAAAAIDHDRVRWAASQAMIADHIEALPEGYATMTGERGVRLSGGQRQRLGIARAFYKRKPFLVLDEATSALDDATERAVMANLQAMGDVTVVMVAHRLSTLVGCDRLLRVQEGRITQTGTFEEVVGPADRPSSSKAGISTDAER